MSGASVAPERHPSSDGDGLVAPDRTSRRDLALLFLRLGATAFGGPAAHIALMEDEVVTRRRWLTRAEFLDLVGATNLIPGPNSTELAIHIGHRRGGWPGLVVAGACFIFPAALIVTALAWAYVAHGRTPAAVALLAGVKPVMIAVVLQALWRLGRSAISSWRLAAVAVGAIGALAVGVGEVTVLAAAGAVTALLHVLIRSVEHDAPAPRAAFTGLPLASLPLARAPLDATGAVGGGLATSVSTATAAVSAASGVASSVTLWPLFAVFAKIGAVLFGSGYVLLAFLRSALVVERGWLTEPQLLDAIAIGQVTPGPVFTTATFIGYVLAGVPGAIVATVGIFLPAFGFVAVSGPLVPRLRRSPVAGAVLDGVNVASLALMAAVTVPLAQSAITGPPTLALAVVSAVALLVWRVNATWLVCGGALVGLLTGGYA